MQETLETLQQRLLDLNKDLSRITKILAEHPEALPQLRAVLRALSESIKDTHSKIEQIDLGNSN